MSDETGLGEGDVGEMAKAEAKGAAGRGRGVLCVAVLRECAAVRCCVVFEGAARRLVMVVMDSWSCDNFSN